MNSENTKRKRNHYTDADRDKVLMMLEGGLSQADIIKILDMPRSAVNNVSLSYTACIKHDWSALQRLSTRARPTVDWAMKKTGTDTIFAELFPKEDVPTETSTATPAPDSITREEFQKISTTLQDICYLLTEIRDLLK